MSDVSTRLRSLESAEYMLTYAGNPNGFLDAAETSLCYDKTTGNIYVNLDGVVSWALVGGGGGGGAPNSAEYLVLALNGGLTAERRLDMSARFATVDGGANADYDVDLAASGVVAGGYGSATQVGTFTVDTYGRLTTAANVAITGTPPVAHDVLGAYHGDTVANAVTRGSLIYGNATPKWDELTLGGIAGSVLTRNATDALWSTYGLAGTAAQTYTFPTVSANIVGGTGTTGYVAYWDGTNTITGEAQLFYDAGNNRLGINDATPSYTLDLNGIIGINGTQTIYNPHALGTFTGTLYVGNGGTVLSHTGADEAHFNTAVGIDALRDNTTGYINNAMGYSALAKNTTGYANDAHGDSSLPNNTIGNYNVAMGYFSGLANIDGSYNVAVGALALSRNTSTSYNVSVGYNAGSNASGGAAVTSTAYSTFIGNDARPLNNTETNQIVIGSASRGYGSNTATIGTATTTDFYAFGNHIVEEDHFIGITGDVRISFDGSGGLISAILGDAAGSDKFQVVDSGSNVVAYIDSNGNVSATEYYTSDGGSFGISGNELLTVNAAGTFSFSGISGITVEDSDYIGNGSATARLVFDSSGATDYAYFSGCNVGIGVTAPASVLHILSTTSPQLKVAYDANNVLNISTAVLAGPYQYSQLYNSTADGSDNGVLSFAGGGSVSNTRGGHIQLFGNEYSTVAANAGDVLLQAGNVATGDVLFYTGGAYRAQVNYTGDVLIGTATAPGATNGKTLMFGDNVGNPTPGANTAGVFAKDVGGTVEMFAIDEAGNAAQLTPHNYAGPVKPLRGVLHWSQYHRNEYAGVEKWYDVERALLALETLTGDRFIHTRRITKRRKPTKSPAWLKSFK